MNAILRIGLVSVFTFCTLVLFSQEGCKVLKSGISANYEGKCKNGLAHGKGVASGTDRYEGQFTKGLPNGYGTYTWAGGDTYTGDWINGMRHGIGKYTIKKENGDSIQNGVWQQDIYWGPKPNNPVVNYKSGVKRFNFENNKTGLNRVLFDLTASGTRNHKITDLRVSSSSGSDTKSGTYFGYEGVVFPVKIKIIYTSTSSYHSYPVEVRFDFEISEPGDWKVSIDN
jgi:hypothetical protein